MTNIQIYGTIPGGEPNLQNKSVTITENTTTTIQADSGYDGLGSVAVTTNVAGDFIKLTQDSNVVFLPKTGSYALTNEELEALETLLSQTPNVISTYLALCGCTSSTIDDIMELETFNVDAMASLISALNDNIMATLYLISEEGNGIIIDATSGNSIDVISIVDPTDVYGYSLAIEDNTAIISNKQIYIPTEE